MHVRTNRLYLVNIRRRKLAKSKHQQSEPYRMRYRIGASGGIELLQNRGHVKFCRVHGYIELPRDRLVGCALGQKCKDLHLSWSERGRRSERLKGVALRLGVLEH